MQAVLCLTICLQAHDPADKLYDITAARTRRRNDDATFRPVQAYDN